MNSIGLLFVLGSLGAPQPIGIEDALAAAAEAPGVRAANSRAEAENQRAKTARRAALLPSLGGEIGVSRRDRELTLATPVGSFEIGNETQWRATARLTQPILDPAAMFFTAPAARAKAEAAAFRAERTKQERMDAAADFFYGILGLDAQLDANAAFIESLRSRLTQTGALVQEGRAVRADLLRIELALADAQQAELTLRENRATLLEGLRSALGTADLREPDPSRGMLGESPVEGAEEAAAYALRHRKDLAALARGIDATDRAKNSVWAEYLPRVEARGELIWDTAAISVEEFFTQGSLNLVWTPFAAGTRLSRAGALDAEGQALRADLADVETNLRTDVRRAHAALQIARGELEVATTGLGQAEETVRVERLRFSEGRVTASDLLEAERLLRDRRARLSLARWQIERSKVGLWVAMGKEP